MEQEVVSLKTDNEGLKDQIQNLREENQNVSYELTVTNEHLEKAIQVAETPFINGWVYDPAKDGYSPIPIISHLFTPTMTKPGTTTS